MFHVFHFSRLLSFWIMFLMINILFGSPHTCCTMLLAHKWGTEGKWLCCNPHNHSHADHCCACISTHGFACSCTFWHVCFFWDIIVIFVQIFWDFLGSQIVVSFTSHLDPPDVRFFWDFSRLFLDILRYDMFWNVFHFLHFLQIQSDNDIFLILWKSSDLITLRHRVLKDLSKVVSGRASHGPEIQALPRSGSRHKIVLAT